MWNRNSEEVSPMALVKVIELVGDSHKGWQEAVRNAVEEAARTVHNISGVEVVNFTANVEDGEVVEYKVNVKVAFLVDNAKRKLE
jgi:hypothetical protein